MVYTASHSHSSKHINYIKYALFKGSILTKSLFLPRKNFLYIYIGRNFNVFLLAHTYLTIPTLYIKERAR